MPEIPDKKENFETDYQSSLLNTPYSAVESGAAINEYNNYWKYDSRNPYASSPDVISPPTSYEVKSQQNSDHFWKFGEGKTLKVVEEYIKGTYNGHYASDKSKVQVLDMIDAIDDGIPFCRDNLIKYSSRFGKKDGMSKLDALKIIHYGILLYHFAGFNNETQKSNYETF